MIYKSIIWDFDGTLFDTYPVMIKAFEIALQNEGIESSSDDILKLLKVSVGHAIKHYSHKNTISDDFMQNFQYYESTIDKKMSPPLPYAADFCRDFISNGGSNYIFTHRGQSIFEYLNYYNMLGLFAEVVSVRQGFKRKPDADGFLYIINKYDMKKNQVLAVGDRELDIAAAKNAGIKSCLLDTGHISCDTGADYIIKSLNELYYICSI